MSNPQVSSPGYIKIVRRHSRSRDGRPEEFSETIECERDSQDCTVITSHNKDTRTRKTTRRQLIRDLMKTVITHLPRVPMTPPTTPPMLVPGMLGPAESCMIGQPEERINISPDIKSPVQIMPASSLVKDIKKKQRVQSQDPREVASKHLHKAVKAYEKGNKEKVKHHLKKVVSIIRSAKAQEKQAQKKPHQSTQHSHKDKSKSQKSSRKRHSPRDEEVKIPKPLKGTQKGDTAKHLAKLVKAVNSHKDPIRAKKEASHHLKKIVERQESKNKGVQPLLSLSSQKPTRGGFGGSQYIQEFV